PFACDHSSRSTLAMSESQSSQVFMFNDSDPEMQCAYESARVTFRYFWREVAWERRRIISGLDLACVKAPFSDRQRKDTDGAPRSEHMLAFRRRLRWRACQRCIDQFPELGEIRQEGRFPPRTAQYDLRLDIRHQRCRLRRLHGQLGAIPNGAAGAPKARRYLGAELRRPEQSSRDSRAGHGRRAAEKLVQWAVGPHPRAPYEREHGRVAQNAAGEGSVAYLLDQ